MRPEIVDLPPSNPEVEPAQQTEDLYGEIEKQEHTEQRQDAFGDEEHAEIKYKVLKWWYVTGSYNSSFLC